MKKYLDQLQPTERRLVVGIAVVLLVVLNWVFIWPHFSDWGNLERRLQKARGEFTRNETAAAQIPALQKKVKVFTGAGESVAPQNQAIDLMRTIQSQAAACGFGIQNFSRTVVHTNDAFFVEQVQNISVVAKEDQLVDFLYNLGSSSSMIRVRDLELQPDRAQQRLNANIKLVASYQKNLPSASAAKSSSTPPPKTSTVPAVKRPAAPATKHSTAKAK